MAISHNNPFDTQTNMTLADAKEVGVNFRSTFMLLLLMMTALSLLFTSQNSDFVLYDENSDIYFSNNDQPWNPIEQPWGNILGLLLTMELCLLIALMEGRDKEM